MVWASTWEGVRGLEGAGLAMECGDGDDDGDDDGAEVVVAGCDEDIVIRGSVCC